MTCALREKTGSSYCDYMIDTKGLQYVKGAGVAYCSKGFLCTAWGEAMAEKAEPFKETREDHKNSALNRFNTEIVNWCKENRIVLHEEYEQAVLNTHGAIDDPNDIAFQTALRRMEDVRKQMETAYEAGKGVA